MELAQTLVSILCGSVSGAGVTAWMNRMFHRRDLRTKFHPMLNNLMGHYVIRFENPDGQYWDCKVGYNPLPKDEEFVDQRSDFVHELAQYNELPEARELRRTMLRAVSSDQPQEGSTIRIDLRPEFGAVLACLDVVQKKLKLE